jgi:WD40 repeat protein
VLKVRVGIGDEFNHVFCLDPEELPAFPPLITPHPPLPTLTLAMTASSLSPLHTLCAPNIKGSPAWSISFTPDAKFLAVCYGCPDTCVKIWRNVGNDAATHVPPNGTDDNKNSKDETSWRIFALIEGHTRSIRDVKFAPISSASTLILATASFDGMVMIWDADISMYDDMEHVLNVDSSDKENEDELRSRFEAIAQLEGHENEVKHVAWNQTGSLLASCGRDKSVWIWECFLPGTIGGMAAAGGQHDDEDFECLAVLQGHDGELMFRCLVFGCEH